MRQVESRVGPRRPPDPSARSTARTPTPGGRGLGACPSEECTGWSTEKEKNNRVPAAPPHHDLSPPLAVLGLGQAPPALSGMPLPQGALPPSPVPQDSTSQAWKVLGLDFCHSVDTAERVTGTQGTKKKQPPRLCGYSQVLKEQVVGCSCLPPPPNSPRGILENAPFGQNFQNEMGAGVDLPCLPRLSELFFLPALPCLLHVQTQWKEHRTRSPEASI